GQGGQAGEPAPPGDRNRRAGPGNLRALPDSARLTSMPTTTNETHLTGTAESAPDRLAALEQRLTELEGQLASLREDLPEPKATIILFSDSLDKALASMVIATGAAAMGL